MKKLLAVLLLLVTVFVTTAALSSCAGKVDSDSIWEKAVYKTDTAFGNGEKTVSVNVKAGDKSVIFTIKTDKNTLGDAMTEHGLIAGDKSEYGLYLKTVNGITADYDKDGAYWSFNDGNGAMMPVGVDGAEIKDGEKYELVYTK